MLQEPQKTQETPAKPVINVERPTGPRLTIAEQRSLGEVVLHKAKELSEAGTKFVVSFPTKHKTLTVISASTLLAIATHFIVGILMMSDTRVAVRPYVIGASNTSFQVPTPSSSACVVLAASVSGVVACWDADLGVAVSGSDVITWTDQIGGFVLGLNTASGQSAPGSPQFSSSSYNSKAGITCASGTPNKYLATTLTGFTFNSSTSSWFVAVNVNGATTTFSRVLSFLLTGDGGSDFQGANSIAAILTDNTDPTHMTWFQGSIQGPSAASATNTPKRVGVVFNATNGTIFVDNSAAAGPTAMTATLGGPGGNQLVICQSASSIGTAPLDGIIRRIVITNTAVSAGDRTAIDTFLTN